MSRFSASLLTSGALLVSPGAVAIAWPAGALVAAMLTAGALLAVFGAYDVGMAIHTRHETRAWRVPLAHGLACIAFACLTFVFPNISLRVTMLLLATWLVTSATLTVMLAVTVWPLSRTRFALLGWSGVQLLLAILAIVVPNLTITFLLYAGAAYAVAFGATQIGAGLWLRRFTIPYNVVMSRTVAR